MKYTSVSLSEVVKDKLLRLKFKMRKKGIKTWDDLFLYLHTVERRYKNNE